MPCSTSPGITSSGGFRSPRKNSFTCPFVGLSSRESYSTTFDIPFTTVKWSVCFLW
jgi:hypothetical protein